jgi:DNA modification methylase
MTAKVLQGDCRETLKTLPDSSVNCCVTSPPYFGLRDYGHDGQIGLEDSPDAFVAEMVAVFREVRRVLRNDGTLWLNLGDSYVGTGAKGEYKDPKHPEGRNAQSGTPKNNKVAGLKSKDLIGVPWRVAFALQADGWYLRQDIIWHKPNPMPESVTDRCTKAHEYVFLLTKSARYFYDFEAIKEPCSEDMQFRASRGYTRGGNGKVDASRQDAETLRGDHAKAINAEDGRNRRSVWTVNTSPYKGAHFATFPPDLIRPCILAGCPLGGTVLDPFGGSGTTAQVALEEGRKSILCELNPDYLRLIEQRMAGVTPSLWGQEVAA